MLVSGLNLGHSPAAATAWAWPGDSSVTAASYYGEVSGLDPKASK